MLLWKRPFLRAQPLYQLPHPSDTMRVTPRPPSESASNLVSLLSRKGMWLCLLCGSNSREMQWPGEKREAHRDCIVCPKLSGWAATEQEAQPGWQNSSPISSVFTLVSGSRPGSLKAQM